MNPQIKILTAHKTLMKIDSLSIFSSFNDLEAKLKENDFESRQYSIQFIVDNAIVPDKEDYLRDYGVTMEN